MNITLIIIYFIAFQINVTAEECIQSRRFVELPKDVEMGNYMRVHASGNYVLVSAVPHAFVFDITKSPAEKIETPLRNEVAPVGGSWTLLASPNHSDKENEMQYFRFNEVLTQHQNAQAKIKDNEHNELYHSSAELPGSTPEKLRFGTLLYTSSNYREYEANFKSDGTLINVEKHEIKALCREMIMHPFKGTKAEKEELIYEMGSINKFRLQLIEEATKLAILKQTTANRRLKTEYNSELVIKATKLRQLEQELLRVRGKLGIYSGGSGKENDKDGEKEKANNDEDFNEVNVGISEPVLSSDGQYLVGMFSPNPDTESEETLHVFKINGESCTKVHDAGFKTSKPSFAYPDGTDNLKLTFTVDEPIKRDQVYADASETQKENIKVMSEEEFKKFLAADRVRSQLAQSLRNLGNSDLHIRELFSRSNRSSGGSAGIRQVYLYETTTGKPQLLSEESDGDANYPGFTRDGRVIYANNKGFFIVDPNQLPGGSGKCITKADVAKSATTLPAATHQ